MRYADSGNLYGRLLEQASHEVFRGDIHQGERSINKDLHTLLTHRSSVNYDIPKMINSMASRYFVKHQGERAINKDLYTTFTHCTLFPSSRGSVANDKVEPTMTGPDPISTLEFEPSPVRIRHLANTSAENSAESPLSRASHRLPEPQTGEIRDYDQSVPPADSSMTPSQLESLWQDAGDRSQPDPQSWQVSGHQVCRAANPGTHGSSSPKLVRQNQVH
ncbi:receptor kinase 3 [Prunus dulcis]|uniref:Receptor kinase 3 n=1 Tax=Prunus dulcis TaxID=3755 RepID=A0A4Y1QZX7_PRUDU|nr:receptor kinase 3 [Prunus dulcis]